MSRLAVLLLAALVAGGLMAAPAPFRRASPVWTNGWNKPEGEGRFDRDGDKLTITVSGKGASHLLRDVEGDFVVQVRHTGDFRRAGLLLMDRTNIIHLDRRGSSIFLTIPVDVADSGLPYKLDVDTKVEGPPTARPVFFRLERRGNRLWFSWSEDGRRRPIEARELPNKLSRKLKLGIFAEGTGKPIFDKFELTRPAKQGGHLEGRRSSGGWINLPCLSASKPPMTSQAANPPRNILDSAGPAPEDGPAGRRP
jgi:hypothetical protein